MAYLYRHIRLDTNQVFYIGISKRDSLNFSRAYNFDHRHRNKFWINVFNKTKIEVEIIFENITYDYAKKKEIEFINLYKRFQDGGSLTNLTKGGDGVLGFKNPKLSERNKAGIWKGKRHSEETKLKMSFNNKGRVVSEKERKLHSDRAKKRVGSANPNYKGNIYAYKDGLSFGPFAGIAHAAKQLNCTVSRISSVLTGKALITKGYIFKRLAA